jgi:AraC family transcriptional regulator, regulatory protein of adaptative response / DNA-3-methyladenine glycosylase II
MAEIALAAGFASVRAFNDTLREVFATPPTALRRRAISGRGPPPAGTLSLRLAFRRPLCPDNLFGHLAATAVPGVEEWRDGAYRRTLRLPHGGAVVALSPRPDHVQCRLTLDDLRDLSVAITRCRWLLDLDADPIAVDEQLGRDRRLAALMPRPRAGASRGRSVRPSSRCAPCSASRCRPPPRARTPRVSWPRTARRSTTARVA